MDVLGSKRPRRRGRDTEFAVIGLGRFGGRLARRLTALGHTVLGIDAAPGRVREIADEISEALVLDATIEEALVEVDIASFDTAIVTMINDFEASTLITVSLKRLGVHRVIGVADSDRHRDILLRIGADRVIQPIQEGGDRLAYDLALTGILESISLGPDMEMVEVRVPPSLVGKATLTLIQRDLIVLAVVRDGRLLGNPRPEFTLREGDIMLVVGSPNHVETLAREID